MKHNLELKTNIHNRFDIEVKDIRTGEVREKYQAENIVLNKMWTRLCGRSEYFVNIHFGTGAGTLDPARTSLFTHLGTKTAVHDARSRELPTSWWRQKVVLAPEEYVGSELTEVGISYNATSTNLVTHAQIRDMNGNVTSIVKTAYDVITIYATVFITFSTSSTSLSITGVKANVNVLINYLTGVNVWPASTYFYAGKVNLETTEDTRTVLDMYPTASSALTWTADVANKKMTTNVARYGVDQANMDMIEIGLGSSRSAPVCRLYLEGSDIYTGLPLTGIPVGTGNGAETSFALPSRHIKDATLVVSIDGTPTSAFTKALEARRTSVNYVRLEDRVTFIFPENINVMAASSNGEVILALPANDVATALGTYGVYDLTDGRYLRRSVQPAIFDSGTLPRLGDLSADGTTVVLGRPNTSAFYTYDWDGTAWNQRTQAPNMVGSPNTLGISADGKVVGYHCGNTAPYGKIYDWDSINTLWVERPTPPSIQNNQYAGGKSSLSGNGLVFAIGYGYYDGGSFKVYDWDGTSWTTRATPTFGSSNKYMNFTNKSLSYDGSALCYACSGMKTVAIWDGSSWTYRDYTGLSYNSNNVLSSDGLVLVGSGGARVMVWENDAWQLILSLSASDGDGRGALSDSPMQYILPSALTDNKIMLIDMSPELEVITFSTPPADGAVITADYTVNGIHKTNQRVIDLQATIQFGEPT